MEYYSNLMSQGTVSSYIALGALAVVAVFTLLTGLRGFARGIARQLIRTITVAIAAVVSFVVTVKMYPTIAEFCDGKTIEELFRTLGAASLYDGLPETVRELFAAFDAAAIAEFLSLPIALLVLPVLFVLLFFISSAVLLLIHLAVCGILGYAKRNNNIITRVLGMIAGFAQGFVVGCLVLVPVIGTVNFVADAAVRIEDPENPIVIFYEDTLKETKQSPLAEMITKCGGEQLYSAFTTLTIGEEKNATDMRDSGYALVEIVGEFSHLENVADWTALNEEERASLYDIVEIMGDDQYLADVVSGILRAVGESEAVKSSFLENFEAPLDGVIDGWLTYFAETTSETVKGDLTLIFDCYFLLSDNGVLTAFGEGGDALHDALLATDENGRTVIRRLSNLLSTDRAATLLTSLTELSLTILADNTEFGLSVESATLYTDLKDGITNKLVTIDSTSYEGGDQSPEYIADVATALDEVMTDVGITLEGEVIDSMAEYYAEHHSEIEELTEQATNDIIISYYEAFLVSQVAGE